LISPNIFNILSEKRTYTYQPARLETSLLLCIKRRNAQTMQARIQKVGSYKNQRKTCLQKQIDQLTKKGFTVQA